MIAGAVPVQVEWALRGKTPNDWEYRILGCSDGALDRRNFAEALERYSPGTLDDLPQVSVSYLIRADQAGGGYLALAIRELADGQRDAGDREIITTRCFCVPYHRLASGAITYQAMFEEFGPIQLPPGDGPALAAELAAPRAEPPPAGDLAYQVAALLLTGPVCVLGADRTSVPERLRFIDTVMSLLPYGMHSRMSASTWTSSTYATHRFRLFFSNAPRAAQGRDRDHTVVWGQPDRTELPAEHVPARHYLDWLQGNGQVPVLRLAEMTDEVGFGASQVARMLEQVGVTIPGPAPEPPREAETLLLDCVSQLEAGNQAGLKPAIAQLRAYADSPSRQADRPRYQDLVWRRQLLRPGLRDDGFYDVVLRLAFGMPLSYEGYCQLESCLGISPEEAPHRPLLEAIERGGTGDARVTALVLGHLGDRGLRDWSGSGQPDVAQLIAWLAGEWDRPGHARVVCDVTLHYLRDSPGTYDRQAVRAALHDRGYLAPALQLRHPDNPQYQAETAYRFLQAAYGSLDRNAAQDILAGTRHPPTPALLAAVLLLLGDPAADGKAAQKSYLAGQLKYTSFDTETRARLARFIPGNDRLADYAGGTPPRPWLPPAAQPPPEPDPSPGT